MTKRIGDTLFIYEENPQQCDLCGKIAELRPYGPNGACVCFECAMKTPEVAVTAFRKLLTGDDHG